MKKELLKTLSFIFALSLNAEMNINSTVNDIYSLTLPKEQLSFKASYFNVSESLDPFNTVKHPSGNYIIIGESSGGGFEINYGITDYISLYYDFNYLDIDIGDSNLKNRGNDIFARVNLYQNKNYFIDSISFDIGYRINRGSDVEIKSDLMLNALIKNIFPNSHFYIYDGVIKYENFSGSIYDKEGNKIYPYIKIENLQDRTSYFRLIFGKKFINSMFSFYIGYKNINIDTDFNVYPKNNPIIQGALKKIGADRIKFSKDENTFFSGISYLYKYNDYIFELNYEYSNIDRDVEYPGSKNNNHTINLNLSKIVNNNLIVYIGGEFMANGINDKIPYAYNTYIKTSEKYGYLKLGFIYNFTY